MDATYLSSNQFVVTGDKTDEFVVGRRVRMDCGVDGIKYATVSNSSYSSPNTTVTVDESELTSNLATVKYGIVQPGAYGSIPIHSHDGSEGSGGYVSVSGGGGGSPTFVGLTDTPVSYDDGKYLRSTAVGTEWATVSGGTTDHSTLSNLDYASSGHTGFAASSHTHTTFSGTFMWVDGDATVTGTIYAHAYDSYSPIIIKDNGTTVISGTGSGDITFPTGVVNKTIVDSGEPTGFTGNIGDVYIDSDTGKVYKKIQAPGYSSDLCVGGTGSSDSEYNASLGGDKAFDDSLATEWHSASDSYPKYLQYQFTSAVRVQKLRFYTFAGWPDRTPRDFTLKGSNTGAFSGEETDVVSYSSQTYTGGGWKDFEFSNSDSYIYYRVHITGANDIYQEMAECEMLEVTSGWYLQWAPSGGATTLLELTDTPTTYSGSTNDYLRLTASGVVFDTLGGMWTALSGLPDTVVGTPHNGYDFHLNLTNYDLYKATPEILDYTYGSTELTEGGTSYRSGNSSTPGTADNCFDNNTSTFHDIGTTGTWVGYDFGSGNEKKLGKMRHMDYGSYYLTEWKVQASNDDNSDWDSKVWTTLYQGSGTSGSSNGTWATTEFGQNDVYRYFRLAYVSHSGVYWACREIELYEAVPVLGEFGWEKIGSLAPGATTLLGLTDTPSSYDAGKYLRSTSSGTEWATVSGTGGGSSTFVGLTDTPNSYADDKLLKITTSGTEYVNRGMQWFNSTDDAPLGYSYYLDESTGDVKKLNNVGGGETVTYLTVDGSYAHGTFTGSAARAFDRAWDDLDNNTFRGNSENTGWVGGYFNTSKIVNRIRLQPCTEDNEERMPTEFELRAANSEPTNGLTEGTVLYSTSGLSWTTAYQEFDITNSTAYTHYWITLLDKDDSFGKAAEYDVGELEFYSVESGLVETTLGTIASGTGGGATTFLELTDTPATYSGSEGKYLRVTASGIEFADVSITTFSGTSIYGTSLFVDGDATVTGTMYAHVYDSYSPLTIKDGGVTVIEGDGTGNINLKSGTTLGGLNIAVSSDTEGIWHYDSGEPSVGLGQENDFYLDSYNLEFYRKDLFVMANVSTATATPMFMTGNGALSNPENCIDGDENTYEGGATYYPEPYYFEIDFGSGNSKTIKEIIYVAEENTDNENARTGEIYARESTEDSWTTIKTMANFVQQAGKQTITETFIENTTSYRYWRLRWHKNGSYNMNLRLYEVYYRTSEDPVWDSKGYVLPTISGSEGKYLRATASGTEWVTMDLTTFSGTSLHVDGDATVTGTMYAHVYDSYSPLTIKDGGVDVITGDGAGNINLKAGTTLGASTISTTFSGLSDTPIRYKDIALDPDTFLMLHSDTTNGSTMFIDSSASAHDITRAGNTLHSTTQKKFGATSIYFDGTGDYLTVPESTDWNVGTGDFTVEFWMWASSSSSERLGLVSLRGDSSPHTEWHLGLGGSSTNWSTGGDKVCLGVKWDGLDTLNTYRKFVIRSVSTWTRNVYFIEYFVSDDTTYYTSGDFYGLHAWSAYYDNWIKSDYSLNYDWFLLHFAQGNSSNNRVYLSRNIRATSSTAYMDLGTASTGLSAEFYHLLPESNGGCWVNLYVSPPITTGHLTGYSGYSLVYIDLSLQGQGIINNPTTKFVDCDVDYDTGNLWYATTASGIYKASQSGTILNSYTVSGTTNDLKALKVDSDGYVWFVNDDTLYKMTSDCTVTGTVGLDSGISNVDQMEFDFDEDAFWVVDGEYIRRVLLNGNIDFSVYDSRTIDTSGNYMKVVPNGVWYRTTTDHTTRFINRSQEQEVSSWAVDTTENQDIYGMSEFDWPSDSYATVDKWSSQGIATTGVCDSSWHHVALVVSSNNWKVYIDGTAEIDISDSSDISSTDRLIMIGAQETGDRFFSGYMDEIKYSDVARWSSGFTPPTAPYNLETTEVSFTKPQFLTINVTEDGLDYEDFSFENLDGTPSSYDSGKYLRSTSSGTEWATVSGGSGTDDHSLLSNLDYASSSHTGFAPTAHTHSTFSGTSVWVDGDATVTGTMYAHAYDSYSPIIIKDNGTTVISGSGSGQIDLKADSTIDGESIASTTYVDAATSGTGSAWYFTDGTPSSSLGDIGDNAFDTNTGVVYTNQEGFLATTWNPSDKSTNVTLSNGNLTASCAVGAWSCVRAIVGKASGKWYWEVTATDVTYCNIGVGTESASLSNYPGSDNYGCGWDRSFKFTTGVIFSIAGGSPPSPSAGDVISIALDMDNGKIFMALNGTWVNSGNPTTGDNPFFTFNPIGLTIYPMIALNTANVTANFGGSSFSHTVPTGYQEVFGESSGGEWVDKVTPTFLKLDDTPSSYDDGLYLRATASGIQWADGIILKASDDSEWLLKVTTSGTLYTESYTG